MPSQLDIVKDRHPLKKFDILKGPGNSEGSNAVGGNPGDINIIECDSSFLWGIETADTVEQACFSSTVRPDNSENFSVQKPGAHSGECLNTSKGKIDIFNPDDGFEAQLSSLSSTKPI